MVYLTSIEVSKISPVQRVGSTLVRRERAQLEGLPEKDRKATSAVALRLYDIKCSHQYAGLRGCMIQ